MSANSAADSSQSSSADIAKWVVVTLLVVAAVVGNAYFGSEPFLYRVLGVLVLAIAAAVIAAQTGKGRAFIGLLKDARAEVRRVVWPTRQETAQTTGLVVLVVVIMSLLLWIINRGCRWRSGGTWSMPTRALKST